MQEAGDNSPSAVDLFCGAGGLSLGLCSAGFDVVGAVDSWSTAVSSYSMNFSHPIIVADVASASAESLMGRFGARGRKVDLLVGGPPCQGFSVQRIGDDIDVRNHLVLEFARLVAEFRPKLFLMENVPGLLGKRGRPLMDELLHRVNSAGYEAGCRLLDAADYGVPQHRKRVFLAGWLSGSNPFSFPAATATTYRTTREAIGDLPSPPLDYSAHRNDAMHRRMKLSQKNQERIELIPPGGGMEDLPVDLRVNCHKSGADKIGHRFVYGRLHPDQPASTITARFDSFTRGKFGHPYEPRNITLREGARLQSFPDDFRFVGSQEEIAAQIGNAVPPLLAKAICKAAHTYFASDATNLRRAETALLL